MTIVNHVMVGDKEIDLSKLKSEEKKEIWRRLADQMMAAVGYRPVKRGS